ncbi:MAG: hypothetical protein HYY98_17070 [Burkholderiales bacterium]|nr:hypothetical protein [Burkholderiales bacterium]
MAKIILGKRPRNFKRVVSFDLPEGGKGSIEVSFVYRTRKEFGQFVDEVFSAAGVAPASQADDDVKFSLAKALEKTVDTNADYIIKIVDGWNLDAEYSRDAVQQMCDEYPGAAQAVIESYRLAITEGRLGN